jgi:hypothetical protein
MSVPQESIQIKGQQAILRIKKIDAFVKSPKSPFFVIPAKAPMNAGSSTGIHVATVCRIRYPGLDPGSA